MTDLPDRLRPRKEPVQRRSQATVDAIHRATIQVLTRQGLARCTTTRVAERAGVSVGTLYQYYADRQALLAAALSRHLERVVAAVEARCRALRGAPIEAMAAGLVEAFLLTKLEDLEEAKALYAVAAEHGGPQLVGAAGRRMDAAVARMLASAPGAPFEDPDLVGMMVRSALSGPARGLMTAEAPARRLEAVRGHCVQLVLGYLEAVRSAAPEP